MLFVQSIAVINYIAIYDVITDVKMTGKMQQHTCKIPRLRLFSSL